MFGGRMAGVEPADADIEFVPKSAPGWSDVDAVLRAAVRTDGSPCLADGKPIAAPASAASPPARTGRGNRRARKIKLRMDFGILEN